MLLMSLNGKMSFDLEDIVPKISTKDEVAKFMGISPDDFYLTCNGKVINEIDYTKECPVHVVLRLIGGKGGFGSMLRAIGAQIEKTTNREACRDLSGRRLRDINEEKRLKNWINQQAEREKQADDRRQKKLERLCQKPKHEFKDEEYDKERSALPEKVEDALEQGLKASCSSTSGKRKHTEINKNKKKAKLWLGSDEDLSSSGDSADEDQSSAKAEDSEQNSKDADEVILISENSSNSSKNEDTSIEKVVDSDKNNKDALVNTLGENNDPKEDSKIQEPSASTNNIEKTNDTQKETSDEKEIISIS